MKFNIEGLNDEVKPAIIKTIIYLKEAQNIFSSIDIPNDFCDYEQLKKMPEDISNINERLKAKQKWLEDKINKLNEAEKNSKWMMDIIDFISLISTTDTAKILQILSESGVDVKNMTTDEFFQYFNYNGHSYGIDQGLLEYYYYYDNGKLVTTEDYSRIEKMVMEKYNMSAKDSAILITCLNSIGACSYATVVNDIICEFKNSPEEFEKIFGFSMYRKTDDGTIVLNGEELLIDLYVYANSTNFFQQILYGDCGIFYFSLLDGTQVINYNNIQYDEEDGIPEFKSQQYVKSANELTDIPQKYFESKDIFDNYNYTMGFVVEEDNSNNLSDDDMEGIKEQIQYYIENESQISLSMYGSKENPIFFDVYQGDKIYKYNLQGGHAVKVTDITEEGLYFSTWGKEAFITFDELQRSGSFEIEYLDISKN